MPDRLNVIIDESRFRRLCAGETIELPGVLRGGDTLRLRLADIGLVPALKAVVDGMGAGHGTPAARVPREGEGDG